jgi:hypothetical protein
MKAIVESFEIGKNNFSKWIYLGFTVLSITGFFIVLREANNTKWLMLCCILLFGGGYWFALKYKIAVGQQGIAVTVFESQTILWKDITALKYETAYHSNGAELKLKIFHGNAGKKLEVSVKQFNKQKMQRLFEILNEQCTNAVKNEHFVKQASGDMNWKDQLKMY